MLGECGVIDRAESEKMVEELKKIRDDNESGRMVIDPNAEDIHTVIEEELTARLGDAGIRLHTARSRNDQVAVDVRLYLRHECDSLVEMLRELIGVLCDKPKRAAIWSCPGTPICSGPNPSPLAIT